MSDTSSTTYTLTMSCEDGGSSTIEIQADSLADAREQAGESLTSWIEDGEWGTDGASVSGSWTLEDEDGDEVAEAAVTVEIEPDHSAKIREACGGRHSSEYERCCGTDPDDHDWTSEGEGGCTENPGVWSTGGTALAFASHCRTCGLRRSEHHCGSLRRNPGDHDRVKYTMPETWCGECERTDCSCEPSEANATVLIGEWGYGDRTRGTGRIMARPQDAVAVRDAYEAIEDGDLGPNVLDDVVEAGGVFVREDA